ncbi:hypothetical protein H4219_006179, partial [Mycoemilia scoparia]
MSHIPQKLEDIRVGQRFCFKDQCATIRYIGAVKSTEGTWLGVEWDDGATRGKHSGNKDGVQYFECNKSGTPGSFIRYTPKLDFGQSFTQALEEAYLKIDSDTWDLYGLPTTIGDTKAKVEAVGFEKYIRDQRSTSNLPMVALDKMKISSLGDDLASKKQILKVISGIKELNLSRNLLSTWDEIHNIISKLPNLESIDISFNCFEINETIKYPQFLKLKTLKLNGAYQSWPQILAIISMMPNLEQLEMAFNKLTDLNIPNNIEVPLNLQLISLENNSIHDPKTIVNLFSHFK